jgi:hypothetical protein
MTALKSILKFTRCKNCNKVEILSRSNRDGYCSNECRTIYTRCTTCGKYFIFKKGENNETEKDTDFVKRSCSEECKIIYIIHKKQ